MLNNVILGFFANADLDTLINYVNKRLRLVENDKTTEVVHNRGLKQILYFLCSKCVYV